MTTTSNIHVGLSAWSNSTFTLGQRCSNASNAYQCTTGGSSTGAPTGTGSSINNGGVAVFKWLSAIDYTSLASWAAGIPGTLTQPVVGLIWADGLITLGSGFSLSGHTTSSTNTITLQPAVGESWWEKWVPGTSTLTYSTTVGVSITSALGYATIFNISDSNVFIAGLQLRLTNTHSTNYNDAGSANTSKCIFDSVVACGNISGVCTNSLFIMRSSPGVVGIGSATFSCCTFAPISSTPSLGIQGSYATPTVKNCIIMGCTNALGVTAGGTHFTSSHNVVSNSSYLSGVTDTGSLFSKTAANQFVSTTTDFQLKAGADAINAGITDTTNVPSATDCVNTSRPQGSAWDVGCFEYVFATIRPYLVNWI